MNYWAGILTGVIHDLNDSGNLQLSKYDFAEPTEHAQFSKTQ